MQLPGALDFYLDFLAQPKAFINFWLGDSLTEDMWMFLHRIEPSDFGKLRAFYTNPANDEYSRMVISNYWDQLALNQPLERERVISEFIDILDGYGDPDTVPGSDFVIIADIAVIAAHLNSQKLLTHLQPFFAADVVETFMCGTYKELERDIAKNRSYAKRAPFTDIFTYYQEGTKQWYYYHDLPQNQHNEANKEKVAAARNDALTKETTVSVKNVHSSKEQGTFQRSGAKVGRNDPCPCGSGKKYKKCCLNK